jgi:hypothetical protein
MIAVSFKVAPVVVSDDSSVFESGAHGYQTNDIHNAAPVC